MSKKLSQKDFYEIIGAKVNITPRTVQKIWGNVLELIASELRNNGTITIENFGRFDSVKKGGKDEWFTNAFGLQEKRYVEPFDFVEYQPSRNFINYVNEGLVDSGAKNRLQKDKLTSYDKILLGIDETPTTMDIVLDALNRSEKQKKKRKERYNGEKYIQGKNCD